MQINNIQNSSPSFNANLRIIPRPRYDSIKRDFVLDEGLTADQIKLLRHKFEKASKDIEGGLNIHLGGREGFYKLNESTISYVNGEYEDSIPVVLRADSLSTKNEFVDKLVKMLDIFNMREKNFKRVEELETRAEELAQSTRTSSYEAVETLFKMPNWRENPDI